MGGWQIIFFDDFLLLQINPIRNGRIYFYRANTEKYSSKRIIVWSFSLAASYGAWGASRLSRISHDIASKLLDALPPVLVVVFDFCFHQLYHKKVTCTRRGLKIIIVISIGRLIWYRMVKLLNNINTRECLRQEY